MTQGFLVLQRFSADGRDAVSRGAMARFRSSRLPAAEALRRYRGFDGIPWPLSPTGIALSEGLAALEQWEAVCTYFNSCRRMFACELLWCVRLGGDSGYMAREPPNGFAPVGFDYGFCKGEESTYSVLFHEVVFGRYPALTQCIELLNEHLLLSELGSITTLETVRGGLVATGADLEVGGADDGIAPVHVSTFQPN